jgi:hypothetical protein
MANQLRINLLVFAKSAAQHSDRPELSEMIVRFTDHVACLIAQYGIVKMAQYCSLNKENCKSAPG